ncbi:uncharacterized protein LOC128355627 [Scomber japonicus]|uniref:Kisspeptin 1 n=1 Tax=Scomber japonicus TaxID=13676 RepID=D5L0U6_SCOJP|nr:uncharacterized protein LOC128355627 [Scomber japonicus]ADE21654.1 kisspeptin 1 [Scomber japonicus]
MMLRLLVALTVAALSTEVYSTNSVKSTNYSEDQVILKALRDLSHVSILPSTTLSGNVPADKVQSADRKFPRARWWIPKVILPQTVKKHQDMSSYNFNSFGLRYGK